MKKSMIALGLLISLSLMLLSSCDGDSDSSIVGTWQADEMTVMFAAGGVGTAPLPVSWSEVLTFNADGTFQYAWKRNGRSGSGTGSWMLDNRELVLTENGQTERIPYSLNSAYLSVISPVPAGEAELVYTRVE